MTGSYLPECVSGVKYIIPIDRVKAWFWTADNTVLTISRYDGSISGEHHYICWPRERFCWFKDERS